jgi:hypothetical protein
MLCGRVLSQGHESLIKKVIDVNTIYVSLILYIHASQIIIPYNEGYMVCNNIIQKYNHFVNIYSRTVCCYSITFLIKFHYFIKDFFFIVYKCMYF